MKANFENPVMDKRLVSFNEAKNVKLSSVSKTDRDDARAIKEVAKEAIELWHDFKGLKNFLKTIKKNGFGKNDKQAVYVVYIQERIDELDPKKAAVAKDEEPKKEEPKAEEPKTTEVAKHKVGDSHPSKPWVWTEYKPGKFDWRVISKR